MGRATSKPNKGTLRLCTGKRKAKTRNQRVRQKAKKTARPPTMTQKKKPRIYNLMRKRKMKTLISSKSKRSTLK